MMINFNTYSSLTNIAKKPLFGALRTNYFLGDIHWRNNQPHALKGCLPEKRGAKIVAAFEQILTEHRAQLIEFPDAETIVYLNGDNLDIEASWPDHILPEGLNKQQRQTVIKQVIDEIVQNNPKPIALLREILQQPRMTVYIGIGNHDLWLLEPEIQAHVRDRLFPQGSIKNLKFVRDDFYDPVFKTAAVHGDIFDASCNMPKEDGELSYSHKLDMVVMPRLLQKIGVHLQQAGYAPDTIKRVQEIVHSTENVRPVHRAFSYCLKQIKKETQQVHHPKNAPSIMHIVLSDTIEEIAHSCPYPLMKRVLVASLPILKLARFSLGRGLLNLIVTKLIKRVRGDEHQLASAQQVVKERFKDKDVQILVLGHTHRFLDKKTQVKEQETRVINPGSYKETIDYRTGRVLYSGCMVKIQGDDASSAPPSVTFIGNRPEPD